MSVAEIGGNLTQQEKAVVQAALGKDGEVRNHYVAQRDDKLWTSLVKKGYAEPGVLGRGYCVFHVTKAGRSALTKPTVEELRAAARFRTDMLKKVKDWKVQQPMFDSASLLDAFLAGIDYARRTA